MYRELEVDDFQLALKLLHSPAPNAKEEILKLVEKYNSPAPKQQNTSLSSSDSSPIKAPTGKRTAIISDDSETDVEDDDNSGAPDSGGNACYVCRNTDINLNNDSLMKCHDCNTHCHRECHKPSISKTEYDDPRFIWYCTKCKKSVKKTSSVSSTKPGMKAVGVSKISASSSSSLSSLSSSSAAGLKRKPETVIRKPGSSFNPSSSSIPLGKPNPPNLSMSSVQQRIANRKAKK